MHSLVALKTDRYLTSKIQSTLLISIIYLLSNYCLISFIVRKRSIITRVRCSRGEMFIGHSPEKWSLHSGRSCYCYCPNFTKIDPQLFASFCI